ADVVLQDPFGDHFLVVAACLEYLCGKADSSDERRALADDNEPEKDGRDDDESDDRDLEEAGEDWLSQQGFDRKDPYFGG
ncbi:MAG TPA: hypothetical protein PLF25_08730, partial [Accumulibacter sp.]|nr:hypothetical protein [Accumulibacter sp.]